MSITWYSIFGYIATVLAIGMYAPQTFSVVKTKKAGTLSKITFLVILFGCLLWIIYAGIPWTYKDSDGKSVSYETNIINNIPAYVTNVVVILLMLPIVWYLFKESKNRILIFFFTSLVSFLMIVLGSIIMFDRDLILSGVSDTGLETMKYVFISIGGTCTGFPFLPQMIRIVKEKRIGDINIISTYLIIFSNLLWVFFWTGNAIENSEGSMYITTFVAVVGVLMQLPILYVYLKNSKKLKA